MENIEHDLLTRRASAALHNCLKLSKQLAPIELCAFHFSEYQAWKLNPWHVHVHIKILYILDCLAIWQTAEGEANSSSGSC